MFLASLELFNCPRTFLVYLIILIFLAPNTLRYFKVDCLSRLRHTEFNHNCSCKVVLGEISSHFDCECQLVRVNLFYEGINSERSRVFAIYAVVHDQEFSIWGLDSYSLHRFEVPCINTLMEIAIVQYNTSRIASVGPADL